MSVSAIAIVGKNNSPLMIRTRHDYDTVTVAGGSHDHPLDEETGRMKLIHLLHASLDVVDEKQHQLQSREPYLGELWLLLLLPLFSSSSVINFLL